MSAAAAWPESVIPELWRPDTTARARPLGRGVTVFAAVASPPCAMLRR